MFYRLGKNSEKPQKRVTTTLSPPPYPLVRPRVKNEEDNWWLRVYDSSSNVMAYYAFIY